MSKNALWVVILALVVLVGWMFWPKVPATIISPEAGTTVVGTGTPTSSITPVPTVPPKTIVLEQVGVSFRSFHDLCIAIVLSLELALPALLLTTLISFVCRCLHQHSWRKHA